MQARVAYIAAAIVCLARTCTSGFVPVNMQKIDAAIASTAEEIALDVLWLEPATTATPIIANYLNGLTGSRLTNFQKDITSPFQKSRFVMWQMRDSPKTCAYPYGDDEDEDEEDEEDDEEEEEEEEPRVAVTKQVLSKQKALLVAQNYFREKHDEVTYPVFKTMRDGTQYNLPTIRVIIMVADTSPREPSIVNPNLKPTTDDTYQCQFNDPAKDFVKKVLSLDNITILVLATDSKIKGDWDKLLSGAGMQPFYRSLLLDTTAIEKRPEEVDDLIAAFIKEAAVRHAREWYLTIFSEAPPLSSDLILARPPLVSSSTTTATPASAYLRHAFLPLAMVVTLFLF